MYEYSQTYAEPTLHIQVFQHTEYKSRPLIFKNEEESSGLSTLKRGVSAPVTIF